METQHVFEKLRRDHAKAKKDPSHVKAQELLSRLFPEQRALVEDPFGRKALLCPARAGKSYCFAIYVLYVLLTVPNANVLFVAYTREQARKILWNLLRNLDDEFQLGFKFGEAALTVSNLKGGEATLAGCESWGDVDKFRGVPRHLVIIDEAQTWNEELFKNLLLQVIEPRLGDYKGTLVIGGTPGAVLKGIFYDATGPNADAIDIADSGERISHSRPYRERDDSKWSDVAWGWSSHGWPKHANISTEGKNAVEESTKLKKRNRWSDSNPIWVREHLGRWMADDATLVFRYEPAKNDWVPGKKTTANKFGLPEGHAWRFIVSCDLGWSDAFALVVGAYSDTHPDLFQVYEFAGVKMTIGAIAAEVKKALEPIDDKDIGEMVGDFRGRGGVVAAELADKYDVYLNELEQRDKLDHIELFNSGLVDNRIHVIEDSELSKEMLYLAWDKSGLKPRSNQANHHCDAFLGVVRHSQHLEATIPEPPPQPGSAAANKAFDDDLAMKAQRQFIRQRNGSNDRGWYKGL